ncbi:MAG TPA: sulfatase [Solirubrobacteraceae bacterium]|jgi:arylsulfatase A-like enzyme
MTTYPTRTPGHGPLLRAALLGLLLAAAAAIGVALGFLPGSHGGPHAHVAPVPGGDHRTGTGVPASLRPGPDHPNIVFVLTDDLSLDLLPYMPQVQQLQREGTSFNNYFVSDSLCCPSRSSIFTGEFPHDTGVFTNSGPFGGLNAFYNHDDEDRTFNVALHDEGYRTAMMGKYINGYLQRRSPIPSTAVPPGWSEWDVAGWGYREFNYRLNIDGTVHHFGHAPRDYLTDVIARRGVHFIDRSATMDRPFFLELATFGPHTPYVPAPRDRHAWPGLMAPRPANFDVLPTNPPSWLAGHPPLSDHQIAKINHAFRRRVQDVMSVNDMIARVRAALQANGLSRDTYIVFSSDNGLHTGEYRLTPGKLTAFDTDIHVPLVVAGPGVPAGTSTDAMTENVDLAQTFAQMGGTSMASGDGHSLLGLIHGDIPQDWRNTILVEHHGPKPDPGDPDEQDRSSGNPPSYEAMRTPTFLYVEYKDGEREFYDLRGDPYELDNIAPILSPQALATLHADLRRLEECHGSASCWAAGHLEATFAIGRHQHRGRLNGNITAS